MDVHARARAAARPIRRPILVAAAALAASAASSQQPYTTWQTYGGGGHSSQYSALAEIDKSNVAQLEVAWSFPAGERSFVFNPIVVDSTMYVLARDNEIVALDAATGRELWARPHEGPVSARGINYWQSEDGNDRRLLYLNAGMLTAINARTGELDLRFTEADINPYLPEFVMLRVEGPTADEPSARTVKRPGRDAGTSHGSARGGEGGGRAGRSALLRAVRLSAESDQRHGRDGTAVVRDHGL